MLRIDNRVITVPILSIMYKVRSQLTNGKLNDIIDKRQNVLVSCPHHKNGLEQHPSCNIFADDDDKTECGVAHCFSCGYTASFAKFIGDCFDEDEEFGKQWLKENFETLLYETQELLPEINLDAPKSKISFLDESILKQYEYYHPYMWKRKLTQEVVDKFEVGYDKVRQAITFPVRDEKARLQMITARSVNSKMFFIDKEINKPVYLLYDLLQRGVTTAYVCESQINTLYMRTWGYNSIGLIGTGSDYQYNILKHCGIRNYVLCFDGDLAGKHGELRFIKNMPKDILISVIHLPSNKDVNNLTKEEFEQLPKS